MAPSAQFSLEKLPANNAPAGSGDTSSIGALSRLQADVAQEAAGKQSRSYLDCGVHSLVDPLSRWFKASAAVEDEIEGYTKGFVKTVPLMLPGKLAFLGTAAVYALDQARPSDSLATQAVDFALGASKGSLLKATFSALGAQRFSPAAKGVVLGMAARGLDLGLTRQIYVDPTSGYYSLRSGLTNLGKGIANPQSLLADALIFGVAEYTLGAADFWSKGAITHNPYVTTIAMGGTFGASSGAVNEIMRQRNAGEPFDLARVLRTTVITGAVDALAATPAAFLQAHAERLRVKEEPNSKGVRATQIDEAQEALSKAPLRILKQLTDAVFLAETTEPDGSHKNVIFRLADEHPSEARRGVTESFAYKLNRLIGFDTEFPVTVKGKAQINGIERAGYVQEFAGNAMEHGIRELAQSRYGSGSDANVLKLIKADPHLYRQVEQAWVERMVLGEYDNHADNFTLDQSWQRPRVGNIDLDSALPPANFQSDLLPSFKKVVSRFSYLNESVAAELGNKPLSAATQQRLSDFVGRYDSAEGRSTLAGSELSARQVEGVLGRSGWFAENGRFPLPEPTNYPYYFGFEKVTSFLRGATTLNYEKLVPKMPIAASSAVETR